MEGAFRGSVAVQRGLLTRGQLYGPRYRRVLPDVYVPVGTTLDLATRSRAAYLHVAPRGGVLAGYSAAELLGRGCALRRVPAEVLVPRDVRRRPDLLVRRGTVPGSEVVSAGGCRVTCPLRTAWDLARRLPLVDAVVAVDALARRRSPTDPGFDPVSCWPTAPPHRARARAESWTGWSRWPTGVPSRCWKPGSG